MKKITLTNRGFFYRTNDRGVKGLNWRNNLRLPDKTRACAHSISVERNIIEFALLYKNFIIEVDIYYVGKKGSIFKGRYSISKEELLKWRGINGYYTSHAGNQILAIPTVLWDRLVAGESKHPGQTSLF